ncbi:MAG: phosphoglucomutase/phosphomannomutase family protein [Verrucomicrobiota bacterium]|nr:phosphoglucomutase/phosphomannomutase family protein [Verrucomicrobiota bacterium]
MESIKFGTSGWRGIIARDFTYANVTLVAQSIADYLKSEMKRSRSPIKGLKPLIILGHDTRFMGPHFATTAGEVLASNGFKPLLCNRDTPTPVIAHAIQKHKAIGGINMTASHNPAEYQGIKFSTHRGAPAPLQVTSKIEKNIVKRQRNGWTWHSEDAASFQCKTIDPREDYFAQIRKIIDFKKLKRARLKLAIECMYGTGRGYLDALLGEAQAETILFHDYLNPGFDGRHPEPNEEGMSAARECVLSGKAQLGLGLDGDADRFGIVDQDGRWLTPNQVLSLALYHLAKNRKWTGSVVRTVPTSHQVDDVAALFNVRVHETPTGFKHIGALMESEDVIVGGEESGGLSVKGHVPEKDGILACLLMAELYAYEKKPLGEVLREIEKVTGPYFTDRINVRIPSNQKEALLERLDKGLDKIGRQKVHQFIRIDGYKFLLSGQEWVAFRASGTEPLIRCYIEAKSEAGLKRLQRACKKILTG